MEDVNYLSFYFIFIVFYFPAVAQSWTKCITGYLENSAKTSWEASFSRQWARGKGACEPECEEAIHIIIITFPYFTVQCQP